MRKVVLNVDGASRGNPGAAGIGVVVSDERGKVLDEVSEYIGVTTNNVAEYTALVRGLQVALGLGARSVRINADSELLVRQIRGAYKVKAQHLRPLYEAVIGLLGKFQQVELGHVPREQNAHADGLASQAAKAGKSEGNSVGDAQDDTQPTLNL